jgi:N-acetylneuraminic acid mutarotase
MKKKSSSRSAFFSPRALATLIACLAAFSIITGTLFAFFRPEAPANLSQRTLTFAERVAYQRAIEDVYWRHRIWPKERPDAKPSLDAVMSRDQLDKKVSDYLSKSQALEDYWQRPITAEQLQAEMDRMAKNTRQPEVLRELFEALGNDPFVIAECLARPILTENLPAPNTVALAEQPRRMPNEIAGPESYYILPNIADGTCADRWTATTTSNAPAGRTSFTAIWTGTEMIVWGGRGINMLNTGSRYIASTDSWTATSIINVPVARDAHTAVWTGSEMIVWGGADESFHVLNTGGKYNPVANTWIATSTVNAPTARASHTAVWSGTEMIVWAGNGGDNTGGRYNPNTDSWTATSTTNAPSARYAATAVWTGSKMIVWGGNDNIIYFNTGGIYDPSTNHWVRTSTSNAPAGRYQHTAVWTGTQMIVWGGYNVSRYFNTGGLYNPNTDNWTATTTANAPTHRALHTAVWTGSEMIVWGGYDGNNGVNTGGKYNPGTNSWTATTTTNAPTARFDHQAVWTDSEMIIWGSSGDDVGDFNSGGRYCGRSGPAPPGATTNPANNVASNSATLNGTVNPHGLTTTVYFQYGTTISYGSRTPNQTATGNTTRSVTANISGLTASTTYHFRIVAHNSAGTTYGNDRTFTTLSPTGPPVVITNPATLVASYSARLNGSLDPHGLTTTVYFQYGTTTSYGLTTAPQSKSGNTYQNVLANISGLMAGTTYHFRIVATNSAGTRYGADRTFTALSSTGPPVVITNPATNVTSSSATLKGTVDPHGLNTSVHFQYGLTTSYGSTTASQTKTGNTYQNVSANISGLSAHRTYHFRIIASNSAGTRYGADKTFTTP